DLYDHRGGRRHRPHRRAHAGQRLTGRGRASGRPAHPHLRPARNHDRLPRLRRDDGPGYRRHRHHPEPGTAAGRRARGAAGHRPDPTLPRRPRPPDRLPVEPSAGAGRRWQHPRRGPSPGHRDRRPAESPGARRLGGRLRQRHGLRTQGLHRGRARRQRRGRSPGRPPGDLRLPEHRDERDHRRMLGRRGDSRGDRNELRLAATGGHPARLPRSPRIRLPELLPRRVLRHLRGVAGSGVRALPDPTGRPRRRRRGARVLGGAGRADPPRALTGTGVRSRDRTRARALISVLDSAADQERFGPAEARFTGGTMGSMPKQKRSIMSKGPAGPVGRLSRWVRFGVAGRIMFATSIMLVGIMVLTTSLLYIQLSQLNTKREQDLMGSAADNMSLSLGLVGTGEAGHDDFLDAESRTDVETMLNNVISQYGFDVAAVVPIDFLLTPPTLGSPNRQQTFDEKIVSANSGRIPEDSIDQLAQSVDEQALENGESRVRFIDDGGPGDGTMYVITPVHAEHVGADEVRRDTVVGAVI